MKLACDIQMSQPKYANGETVTAQGLRVANRVTTSVSIKALIWLARPDQVPLFRVNLGANGDLQLPAFPRGAYAFNCRMLDPVTKRLLHYTRTSIRLRSRNAQGSTAPKAPVQ